MHGPSKYRNESLMLGTGSFFMLFAASGHYSSRVSFTESGQCPRRCEFIYALWVLVPFGYSHYSH